MSKPPTEQLVTCDLCGQANILPRGLAAHQKSKHCRDARKKTVGKPLTLDALEVLPPIKRAGKGKPMPLAEIEDHIRAIDARIDGCTRGFHNEVIYEIVGKGLMLLKGREAHLRQGQKALVETVSTSGKQPTSKALAKAEEASEKGFLAWLDEKFPEQSSRTARNYMNAARNVGLTSDHTLDDVQALKLTMALHEKKPTDLYRLADAVSETPDENEPAPQPNLVADLTRDLFSYLDDAIVLRDNMEPEQYEAVHSRLHATLEKLTGAKWVMLEEAPSADGAQHGEQHGGKPAKKKAVKKGGKRK